MAIICSNNDSLLIDCVLIWVLKEGITIWLWGKYWEVVGVKSWNIYQNNSNYLTRRFLREKKINSPSTKIGAEDKEQYNVFLEKKTYLLWKRRIYCQAMFGSFLALFLHSFRWWKPGKDKNIVGYLYLILHGFIEYFVCLFRNYSIVIRDCPCFMMFYDSWHMLNLVAKISLYLSPDYVEKYFIYCRIIPSGMTMTG